MTGAEQLRAALEGGTRLVVYLHDSPDPDAMAAGWLLRRIGQSLGLEALVVYGGSLGRAENRAMVRVLDVPLVHVDQADLTPGEGDRYALVDTQPGSGNNSFPHKDLQAQVVVDHHPSRTRPKADFVDLRIDEGCSTTLLVEHFEALGLELDPPLATAVLYAIISETQDLDREATRADKAVYLKAMSVACLASLGKIRHPARDRAYYRTVARAMKHVMVGKNTCVCHIGDLPYPEVVAEMADFLVAMQQISWCLATGLHGAQMVLSVRTTQQGSHPEQVMRGLLARLGRGGGHGMIAGGSVRPCDAERYEQLALRFTDRFLEQLGRRVPERLRPLLEEEGGLSGGAPDE